MTWKKFLEVAFDAVNKAEEVIRSQYLQKKEYHKKGIFNLVTETDRLSEKVISETILSVFPSHSILAEEEYSRDSDCEYKWIIDPIDGTTNFVHSLPFIATSIALEYKKEIVLGVVNNPKLNERYWSIKGEGAYFNDHKMKVSDTTQIKDSLIATGFPYNRELHLNWLGECAKGFLNECRDLRRYGSASLDLCLVARGSFDGYYERQLKPWDVAAGILILQESGGEVISLNGEKFDLYEANIIATNGKITKEMLRIVNSIRD